MAVTKQIEFIQVETRALALDWKEFGGNCRSGSQCASELSAGVGRDLQRELFSWRGDNHVMKHRVALIWVAALALASAIAFPSISYAGQLSTYQQKEKDLAQQQQKTKHEIQTLTTQENSLLNQISQIQSDIKSLQGSIISTQADNAAAGKPIVAGATSSRTESVCNPDEKTEPAANDAKA